MIYKTGDRVRHPSMDGWGVGQVLEDSDSATVRVFFAEAGEKTISLKFVQPVLVSGALAESMVLDNLRIDSSKAPVRYRSLRASIAHFLQEFPGGFEGERFRRHERDHKLLIANEVRAELERSAMEAMLANGESRAICERALKLTGVHTNAMIFKNEKMALRDGLKSDIAAESFAKGLFDLLHGSGEFKARFDGFAAVLEDVGACKWTVATYFPFFMYPNEHMFVKPTITQNAAELCAFEIGYRPDVNSKTYAQILKFSQYLRDEIRALEPRDMIDVQSFMWCIAPGSYGPEDA